MYKIMIDPGHGGKDRANRGPTGYVEADGVLDISLKLKDELVATGAFEVKLTRETDATLGVRARGKMAASWGADMFISEHTNSSGLASNTTVRGTEVYTSVDLKDDALGAEMAKAVAESIGTKNIGAKKRKSNNNPEEDYYAVIDEAQDGGVAHILLIESAFHDNKDDEALLKDDGKRAAIAKAQAAVICKFYGVSVEEEKKLNWRQKIVQEALDLGLITDKTWVDKADETSSIWFVCAIAISMYKKLKG
ncbi:N-acetylmuramoyl-L-alanine amidase family protein [Acetivibrio cellulolyticus]|uniref:N-acetylmuramoyl-L-alanine amidase family protein n=1 Tax=Acetivibrio cellulolyticus TaxID=35830 RepID=UPI0001E2C7CD|nr:N-acetylmuramoyl-L-alanine amidase [Acetivibrio cellulolyticus]